MRRDKRIVVGAIAAGGIAVALGAGVLLNGKLAERRGQQSWTALKSYCTDCHNDAERAGDVIFEGLAPEAVPQHAETFEAAIRKLRGRLMPPPGNPQPEQALIDDFVAFAETSIDRAGRDAGHAGHVPIQRLNRTEYAASVHDLLDVDIDATEYLPTEIEVDGFENIAAALSVSPAFLEQYIGVARAVARLAVGDSNPKLASVYFPPPADTAQDDYVDGMPLGTRGGARYTHNFPADGEYRITLTDLDVGLYPRSLETEHTVVILLDRHEVFRGKLGGAADLSLVDREGAPGRAQLMQRFASIPVAIKAGVHELAVTFVERARASTDEPIGGFVPYGGFSFRGEQRVPRLIGGIEMKGPFAPSGVSRTASRQKIFVCTPETPADERGCAERIAANLARRAYRRPVGQEDVERLMPFYEAGRAARGNFDAGVEQLLTAVLASPDFLYRAIAPPQSGGTQAYALSDLELASRLSFFLWSRGPDDELLELASAGKLHDPGALREQARRMLADPRAEALVTNFALKWLNLDELEAVDPDDRLFPNFSDELRDDFATEIRLFLRHVLLEDHNVQELLTSDQTFLNEALAKHYGVSGVHGPQFRQVALTDEARFGLLGKGATLLRTSYGDRTSPVLRGAWVLDKLMGTPPTPPPPNVVTDLTQPAGEKPKTMRVRLERHRTDPTCSGCHSVIDPYGLALENFDATGEWRELDAQAREPIDASTVLPTGAPVTGPVELRNALLARDDQFVQALTQKLLMYAIGRELEYYDMPTVRAIVRDAAKHDYRLSAIVAGIVQSDAFRLQGPLHENPTATPLVAAAGSARD